LDLDLDFDDLLARLARLDYEAVNLSDAQIFKSSNLKIPQPKSPNHDIARSQDPPSIYFLVFAKYAALSASTSLASTNPGGLP
jgi:hypothetical protein